MTISVWGWGSTAISTWGWGGYYRIIPEMAAEYIRTHVYTCVIDRECTEILDRETGEILFRLSPTELPGRSYDEILERIFTDILDRGDGWSYDLVSRNDYIDNLLEIRPREADDVIFRLKPEEIPQRVREEVLKRISTDQIQTRGGGWPWESDPCLDE